MDPMESNTADDEAPQISGALVAAIDRLEKRGSLSQRKAELVQQMAEAVSDPHTDVSVYGRAADIVILSEAGADGEPSAYGRLIGVLKKIERIREAKRAGHGDGFRTSPGAFFLNQVRRWPEWREPGESMADAFPDGEEHELE